jgi:hypothetical protein
MGALAKISDGFSNAAQRGRQLAAVGAATVLPVTAANALITNSADAQVTVQPSQFVVNINDFTIAASNIADFEPLWATQTGDISFIIDVSVPNEAAGGDGNNLFYGSYVSESTTLSVDGYGGVTRDFDTERGGSLFIVNGTEENGYGQDSIAIGSSVWWNDAPISMYLNFELYDSSIIDSADPYDFATEILNFGANEGYVEFTRGADQAIAVFSSFDVSPYSAPGAVPEPGTYVLIFSALTAAGAIGYRRHQVAKKAEPAQITGVNTDYDPYSLS